MKTCAVLALAMLGCAGPGLRGAVSAAPEREPSSDGARFVTRECRDEHGAAVQNLVLDYVLVSDAKGPLRLIEHRAEHDSVVIQNSYEQGGARVFAYVSGDAKHPDVLHRIRLNGAHSELCMARAFAIHDSPHGFRAEPEHVLLCCALARLEADADAAHANPGG